MGLGTEVIRGAPDSIHWLGQQTIASTPETANLFKEVAKVEDAVFLNCSADALKRLFIRHQHFAPADIKEVTAGQLERAASERDIGFHLCPFRLLQESVC
jgi:hypothetical protein